MTLAEAKKGQYVKVLSMHESPAIKARLQSLGMMKDTVVQVNEAKRTGTSIVSIRGTRFALGKDLTRKIEVEEWRKN